MIRIASFFFNFLAWVADITFPLYIRRIPIIKTTSPLGIETYLWEHGILALDRTLVCSILERNGQGWFIRTTGNWIGERCLSEEDAINKANKMFKNYIKTKYL